MIGYIEGKLLKKEDDRVLILANQIGYEVMVPVFVMKTLESKPVGDQLSLYIYYQQTERQPRPVLIGFNLEEEKEFFQQFISVGDIGPFKAVKALDISIHDIASAIETKDVDKLKQLKGIGARTAQKIIAALEGKVGKFIRVQREAPLAVGQEHITSQVLDVLVTQLGHKPNDARQMIAQAFKRNRSISTPEQLFDEVYRGERFHGNG
ncbi:MAG: OB-fold domain-containing protein [Desulfobacterales bacterium]|nr:OB-fold domain-containing protein [Desulfobacterales bacterium]MDD4071631.1 OB-fold domain-containing protein [Desulfobacterales bacterium]MDD4391631.1 OB-fold domain-containing protein [Desulfobacterales bacterium]